MNRNELLATHKKLCSLGAPSGFEKYSADLLISIISPFFSQVKKDNLGGVIAFLKDYNNTLPTVILDAHFDEVGIMCTDIQNNGEIHYTNLGGLDRRVLNGSKVLLYDGSNYSIPGIIALKKPTDGKRAPGLFDLFIDTGLNKDELAEKNVSAGTPGIFVSDFTFLNDDIICTKSQDNRSGCSVITAVADNLAKGDITDKYNIIAFYSAREEISGIGTVIDAFGIDNIKYAIVIDTEIGAVTDNNSGKTVEVGCSPSVCISPICSEKLTNRIIAFASKKGIELQTIAAPNGTGTNADELHTVGSGIECAVLSVPLKNMHTPNEITSISDHIILSELISGFISEEEYE